MSWLKLSVDLQGANAKMQEVLDLLRARQLEQERLRLEVASAAKDALKPPEGSNPRDKARRIEPIGFRASGPALGLMYVGRLYVSADLPTTLQVASGDGSAVVSTELATSSLDLDFTPHWPESAVASGSIAFDYSTNTQYEIYFPSASYGGEFECVLPIGQDAAIYAYIDAQEVRGANYKATSTDMDTVSPSVTITGGEATAAHRNAKCFYVGRSVVRELTMPGGLESALNRMIGYPWPGFGTASTQKRVDDTSAFFPAAPTLLDGNADNPLQNRDTYLFRSLGIGRLDSSVHDWEQTTYSAAVYDYLSVDPATLPLVEEYLLDDYTEGLAAVNLDLHPNNYVSPILETIGEEPDEAYIYRAYTTATPENIYQAVPLESLTASITTTPVLIFGVIWPATETRPEVSWEGGGYRLLFFTDNGRADVCRQRLLALGFTEADLQP